jgi:hypothetical protein
MAHRSSDISRRDFKTSMMGTALAPLPGFAARAAEPPHPPSMSAVVDTAGNKVRGVVSNSVHIYRDRHGASTAGANRFMPPRTRAVDRCA